MAALPPPKVSFPSMANLAGEDIDIATRGAEQFINVYYAAYDAPERAQSVSKFYRKTSSIVWNGNPVQGDSAMSELMMKMPLSKHEVHSFDCHPIPNTSPPSLLVSVSGTVIHGKAAATGILPTSKNIDDQLRIFSQAFMLAPDVDSAPGAAVKYYVLSDDMRFVG